MASIKKILFVFFFFQLAIAASAGAETIVSHYQKSGNKADAISRLHQNINNIVEQQEVDDDSPDAPGKEGNHGRAYVRFVHSRHNNSVAALPFQQVVKNNIAATLKDGPVQNEVIKASLPAYYGFLFRLSPF